MPALNFQKRFEDLIIQNKKRQSIRPYRKDNRNPIKGCKLYLYVGMRTKSCRKLKETICKNVEAFSISHMFIVVGANTLNPAEMVEFARREGFMNYSDFMEFFEGKYKLPFHGLLIEW